MFKYFFVLVFLFMMSCSSPESFLRDSEHIQKQLLTLFQEVETIEDLTERGPVIRQLSMELVKLIEKVNEYYKGKKRVEENRFTLPVSEALQWEMKRIYEIEGAREIVEKYQREALIRLDDSVR